VNWFRQDKDGKFLWPGFGENLRILEWVLDRCNDKAGARKTPIGFVPNPTDIDMTGLKLSNDKMRELLLVDKKEWKQELKGQKEFLSRFEKDLPQGIKRQYLLLKKRLGV